MVVWPQLSLTKEHDMPTLVIDNVPATLFDRLQLLAKSRSQTPADAALEVLETAFRSTPVARLPQEPFLTEEISAPCSIPRPDGKPARTVRVPTPLPRAHDLSDEE